MASDVKQGAPAPAPVLGFAPALAALAVGAVAMGVSPVFVRLAEVGPFASAFWRVGLALPVLLAWAAWEARARAVPLAAALRPDRAVLLAGLFFAGDLIFWHLAILNTTVANATFMACLAPIWVLMFSRAFIGEEVDRTAFVGLALCLAGSAALLGSSLRLAPERLLGDVYGFVTSLFFGLYFLAVRAARRRRGAGALTFSSTAVTAAVLLVAALAMEPRMWPLGLGGVAALLALGILSHCGGQGLLAVALGSLTAAFSSLVIFVEALAAALFGWLVFAEPLSPLQWLGGALIMAGIFTARPRGADPAAPSR